VSKIAVGMNGRIVSRQGRARGSAGERMNMKTLVSRQGRARGSAGERMNMKTLVLGLGLSFRIGVRALVERVGVSAMANRTRPAGLGGTVVMTRYSRCSFSSRSLCKFIVEFT
jgi:hypothetical protein